MKVYVATSGSYSDYGIDHVFARKEDAEAYASSSDEGSVREFHVSTAPVERRAYYRLGWRAYDDDGPDNPWEFVFEGEDYPADATDRPASRWVRGNAGPHRPMHTLMVEGWDREAVRKAYQDKRAEYEAREQGIS